MSQLVIQAAGAAVGFFIGGPAGAKWGWAIGGIVAGAFAPTQKSQGPRLGDLRVTGSEYGAPIPWTAAHPRLAGQIIWASAKREIATTTEQGKGGGGAEYTSYAYELDVLILLTDNEIQGVSRVWENGKLVYTNLTGAPSGSASASEGTTRWRRMTVYGGDAAQMPDSTYEAAVDTANASAYRGRGTVFIEGWQLGGSGQLTNLEFEVYRSGTQTLPLTRMQCTFSGSSSADVSHYLIGSGVQFGGVLSDGAYTVTMGDSTAETRRIKWENANLEVGIPATYGDPTEVMTFEAFFRINLTDEENPPDQNSTILSFTGGDQSMSLTQNGNTGYLDLTVTSYGSVWTDTVAGWGDHHVATVYRADHTYDTYLDGVLIWTASWTNTYYSPGSVQLGSQNYGSWDNREYVFYGVRVRREEVYTGAQFSPPISPADWGEPDPVTVAIDDDTVQNVVSELCQLARPGTSWFDVSDLAAITTPVRALKIGSVSNVRSALQVLGAAYLFAAVGGDKVYFRTLGGSSVATIPWDDLGADGNADAFTPRLVNELEVPAQVALTYSAVENDYQPDTQLSDRLLSSQVSTEIVELPLAFTASEAKSIADVQLLQRVVSMTTASIVVDNSYSYLQVHDVIVVVDEDGNQWRMRIGRIEHVNQTIKLDLALDDASIYTQAGLATAGTQGQTSVGAPASTRLYLLDIPLLRDNDNVPGFYVAVQGNGSNWHGAGLYYASNDSSYALVTTIVGEAPVGRATTALAAWSGGDVWDEISTVTVDVGTGTLASVTRDNILESDSVNAAIIGSELIQYRTATLVATGIYTLSGLLRGRRGTGWAMTGHAAGDVFCALTSAGMRYVTLQSSELGKLRYYKAASAGQLLSAVSSQTITPAGVSLECIAPVDARVNRAAADHVVTWRRGTRLSTRLVGPLAMSAPLGEESESYEVDIFASAAAATAGTPVLRTITASSQTCTYTSAQRTTDGTGSTVVYMRIYQLSATVGRGYPLITQG